MLCRLDVRHLKNIHSHQRTTKFYWQLRDGTVHQPLPFPKKRIVLRVGWD